MVEKQIYRDNWITNFNIRKLTDDKNVLVSPGGDWEIVSNEETALTKQISIPHYLYNKLETNQLITTCNNSQSVFEQYHRWNRGHYTGTSLHIVVMTRRCNLKCLYCHASAKSQHIKEPTRYDLNIETAKKIVDFIFQTHNKEINIEFQGGESLLNFDVLKFIVKYAQKVNKQKKKTLKFNLVSNLLLLEPEHCKFFKKHKVSLCTSLDGPSFIHDYQRRHPKGNGSYEQLIQSFELLKQEDMQLPGLLIVMTKKSIEYYKELLEMVIQLGLRELNINYVQPLGYARKNWGEIGIDYDTKLRNYKSVLDYTIEKWKDGIFIIERLFLIAVNKIFGLTDTLFTDFKNPCGMAIGQLTYLPNGDIFSCDEGRNFDFFKLGNIESDNYTNILTSPKTLALVSSSIPDYTECQSCAYRPFCGICPVLNYAQKINGNNDPTDPRCRFNQFIYDYIFNMILTRYDVLKSYLIYRKFV